MKTIATALVFALTGAGAAGAATLADIDLSAQSFDRISYSATSANGLSNDIAWTLNSGPYAPFTGTNTYETPQGSFTFEDLHEGGTFTITFGSAITSILFLLENDNAAGASIDLGIAASDFGGGVSAAAGTSYVSGPSAGWALFEFAATTTVMSVSAGDGTDMTFFANAAPVSDVPVPAAGLLLLGGLGVLAGLRRKG